VALESALRAALEKNVPVAIRYPRGEAAPITSKGRRKTAWGVAEVLRKGADVALWAMGRECATALEAAGILEKKGVSATVVDARFVKPFDKKLLLEHAAEMPIATIEDCQIEGGLGAVVDSVLSDAKHQGVLHFGWDDSVIPHGTVAGIRKKAGMTPAAIAARIAGGRQTMTAASRQ